MRQVMVRYRVHADRVAENEALVRAVYEELRSTSPEGFHYATFTVEDGTTFVHVAGSPRCLDGVGEQRAAAREKHRLGTAAA